MITSTEIEKVLEGTEYAFIQDGQQLLLVDGKGEDVASWGPDAEAREIIAFCEKHKEEGKIQVRQYCAWCEEKIMGDDVDYTDDPPGNGKPLCPECFLKYKENPNQNYWKFVWKH